MSELKVMCVLAGDDASARLRMEWPAGANAQQGRDVICAGANWRLRGLTDQNGRVHSIDVPKVDVIVFQRLCNAGMTAAIPLLQEAGVTVVIEVDDDFTSIDPNNTAYAAHHPTTSPDSNFLVLAEACKLADLVTVTTPALARIYGNHGRVAVLPNRLPAAVLDVEAPPHADPPRVGWAGSVSSHPNDLQATRGQVARVCLEHRLRFVNVGPGGTVKPLGLDGEQATGWVPPWEWYPTIASELDIAIAPLAATRFNAAKSSLKLLEHSATGVPCVASPNEDNQRLHALGMGVLASKPKDWYRELSRLVTDYGWRREVAARSKAAAKLETLEDHAHLWWEAWSRARELHAARH